MKNFPNIVSAVFLAIAGFYMNQTADTIKEVKSEVKELRSDFHGHEKDFKIHKVS